MNKGGSISFFLAFVFLAVLLLTVFVLIIPALQQFNVALFEGAEGIVLDANSTAAGFENEEIRESLQGAFQAQYDSVETQVDILGTFFQYAWIVIIAVIVLVLFIITRQSVELEIR